MDTNRNDSLFTYLDSLETQDFYINYRNKKIPKLNKYAEMYLAKLDQEKSDKGIISEHSSKSNMNLNNDIINNNDNISSIKDFSNDITNNDSIINPNKIKNKLAKDQSNESNLFKTISYLSIEQLRKNMENNPKKQNVIIQGNTFTIFQNNNKIKNKKIQIKEQNNKYYKQITASVRNKLKARLFFNFRNNESLKLGRKINFSNNIKTHNNLNFSKSENMLKDNNTKNKSFFPKVNDNNNNNLYLNFTKNKYQMFPLSNYKNNPNSQNTRKELISKSFTENSQYTSITSKNNKNQIYSLTSNDYWIKKEIKNQIKKTKLIQEKRHKEFDELKDKPTINNNSRIIAEKLGSNSSTSVFERLSKSTNKILFNQRKINILTNTQRINNMNKTIESYGVSKRNKKNLEINDNYKTFKQLEVRLKTKPEFKCSRLNEKNIGNKRNVKKYETNRIKSKYINKFDNFEKVKKYINNKVRSKINKNNNYLCFYNSTENINNDKNQINDKIKKLLNNKRLSNFFNKNQSIESLNNNNLVNKRKEINQNKIVNQSNKTISILTKDIETMKKMKENYNKEKFKKILSKKLLAQKLKDNKIIIKKKNIEKNIETNKINIIKNNKIENIITMNSSNTIINNRRKNNLNISSNQINDDINKITRRKMDLMKILNFSSNIGINNKIE